MAAECTMNEKISKLADLLQNEKDLRAVEQLRATEREKALRAEMKQQKCCSDCVNTLEPKVNSLESHNQAFIDEMIDQLKMGFENMAKRYKAERIEKEDLQNEIQKLKIRLQNRNDFCTELQLRGAWRENVLCQKIADLRETLQRKSEDKKVQAWETERNAYMQEIADLKLCHEEETLRFHDICETLKADKADKESMNREQSRKIQALNNKIKEQQEFYAQERMRAFDRERVLRWKLKDLKEKISCYVKEAQLKLTATSNSQEENHENLLGECSGEQRTKKLKGWRKLFKPSLWGKT